MGNVECFHIPIERLSCHVLTGCAEGSHICRILASGGAGSRTAAVVAARGRGFQDDLLANGDNPLVLEQFGGSGATGGIAFETAAHKVNAQITELVAGWERRLLALSDVVHDGPFIV